VRLERLIDFLHLECTQSKELQKTLEGAASGKGEAVKSEPFTGEVPVGEGEDAEAAEAKEEVDGRSVYVGNVSVCLYAQRTIPDDRGDEN
jgi:hypothetical protein